MADTLLNGVLIGVVLALTAILVAALVWFVGQHVRWEAGRHGGDR